MVANLRAILFAEKFVTNFFQKKKVSKFRARKDLNAKYLFKRKGMIKLQIITLFHEIFILNLIFDNHCYSCDWVRARIKALVKDGWLFVLIAYKNCSVYCILLLINC